MLDSASVIETASETSREIDALNRILSSLKIRAKCVAFRKCRNIDLYDIALGEGTRVRQIERFTQEIGLGLRAKCAPIVRLILEQGIVRLQVVADDPKIVDFDIRRNMLPKPKSFALPFYLGETLDGPLWIDVHTSPHILIAGTSGSGKSTLLHSIIGNALAIDNCDIYLMDTKNIEFSAYADLGRHDINIDTTYQECLETLRKLYTQMEATYVMMRVEGLPSNYFASENCQHPYTLIVIDEFADLIMQDTNDELHDLVCKIAQKGRAAGIHFVLATQRPSVEILRGTIKANFPTRISCRVASRVDSNVIIDSPQAQALLGKGDALIKSATHDLVRFQAAYATAETNIENV